MLLAFDTATPHVTVALHDGSTVVATFESSESMRHGEMLAPGIEAVLSDAGVPVTALTGIAVGVGPGPFTGLRVGLVTARTLALARDVPGPRRLLARHPRRGGDGRGALGVRGGDGCAPQGGLPRVVRRGAARARPRGAQARGRGDRGDRGRPRSHALPGALPPRRRTPSTPRPPYSATSCSTGASRSSTPSRSTCAAPSRRAREAQAGQLTSRHGRVTPRSAPTPARQRPGRGRDCLRRDRRTRGPRRRTRTSRR